MNKKADGNRVHLIQNRNNPLDNEALIAEHIIQKSGRQATGIIEKTPSDP
jgi:hypothetical protein